MPTVTSGGSSNAWEDRLRADEEPVEVPLVVEEDVVEDEVVEEPVANEEVVQDADAEEPMADGPKAAEVRAWALGNDIDVSSRGAIPAAVMDAYVAAH